MRATRGIEAGDRTLEVRACRLSFPGEPGHLAGSLFESRAGVGVIGELESLFEVAQGLLGGGEGSRALAGSPEHLARLRPHRGGVFRLGRERVSVHKVGGHDFDDFIVVCSPFALQVGRDREVLLFSLPLREAFVGDRTNEVLQEPVLTALGRARVELHRDDLFAHEAVQELVESVHIEADELGQRAAPEGLAENRRLLEQTPLIGREAVEARSNEGVKCVGDLEGRDRTDRLVTQALSHEQATVDEHAHGLDGIQGNPFRALKDLFTHLLW